MSKTNIVAFNTIVMRELLRLRRIWINSLLPPLITMTLYFIIFGKLIGSQVRHIHGFSYMAYLTPGLIMMSIVNNSYSHTSFTIFSQRLQKAIEQLIISPASNIVILAGNVLAAMVRGFLVGLIVLIVSLFFTHLHIQHPLVVILVFLLASMLFATAGFINGLLATSFDNVSIVPTFILTPLTYLGGVFYSISMLPATWQKVSLLNPILYLVNAFRYGFLGASDVPIGLALGLLTIILIGFITVALLLMNKGVGLRS